jgi:hypothetical protein
MIGRREYSGKTNRDYCRPESCPKKIPGKIDWEKIVCEDNSVEFEALKFLTAHVFLVFLLIFPVYLVTNTSSFTNFTASKVSAFVALPSRRSKQI